MSLHYKTFNLDSLPLSHFPQLIIVWVLRGLKNEYKEGGDTFVDDLSVVILNFYESSRTRVALLKSHDLSDSRKKNPVNPTFSILSLAAHIDCDSNYINWVMLPHYRGSAEVKYTVD